MVQVMEQMHCNPQPQLATHNMESTYFREFYKMIPLSLKGVFILFWHMND